MELVSGKVPNLDKPEQQGLVNYKTQITNYKQLSNYNARMTKISFFWNFRFLYWNLFVIWNLLFGA